ncbi:cell adhesion molecule-related/down-regulated by oncogenes-like isoform X2 [Ptychodera flava]|uniref:cell adhesion molecule-related/down-regulated by oncogenes-like isoform X2 n=1 Tax=Ptychodera flava TaxID=63121 RepID=UPI003969CED8
METPSLPLYRIYILALCYTIIITVLQICNSADAEIAPRFVQEPQSQVVKKKSKVRFHCTAEPHDAEIRWKYNGQFIESDEANDIEIRGWQLIVRSFRHERNLFTHTGTYQCIVNNSVGAIASKPVKLEAAYIKPFTEEMEPQATAIVGHTAVIKCSPPESLPPARTEYRNQGEWVAFNTDRMKILPSGNLQIANVTSEDKGNYKCSAVNPVSDKRQTPTNSTKLVIIGEDTMDIDMPAHIEYTSRATVRVGENATLECIAKGKPLPRISWIRQNGDMPEERIHQYLGNLVIQNVQESDEGPYVCVAENGVALPHRQQVSLSVIVPPVIVEPPQDVAAKFGDRVEFRCEITGGNPVTDIQWLFNAEPISDMSLKHSLLGNRLIVHAITENQLGMYQCMVINRQGVTQATARLKLKALEVTEPSRITTKTTTASSSVRQYPTGLPFFQEDIIDITDFGRGSVPEPPDKPRITKTSDSSVMVRWTFNEDDNGGSPVTAFKVEYRELHSLDGYITANGNISPKKRMYEVTNLQPDSMYRFRMIAVNEYGESRSSELSHRFLLKADRPTTEKYVRPPVIAPYIKHSEAANTTAIKVVWEYTASLDGVPIDGFYIYHRLTDRDEDKDYVRETVRGVNTREHVICHLEKETSYDIKMQTFNQGGAGEFSNVIIIETKAADITSTVSTTTTHHPTTQTLMTTKTNAPVAKKSSRADSDMLYLIIGIIVGIMILMIVVFIAMCTWRSKLYNGTPPVVGDNADWNKRQYYDPNCGNHMENGSVSGASQAIQSNGNAINSAEALPYPTLPLPPTPLTNGHVYCHDINAVNFNNPHEYKEVEPAIITSPLPHDMSFSSNANHSDHSYSTVSERNKKNMDGYHHNRQNNSRHRCCSNSTDQLCSCDHARSHSNRSHSNNRSNKHRKHHKDHHYIRRPDCSCSSNYSGTESEQCLSDPMPPPMVTHSDLYLSDPPPIRYNDDCLSDPPPPPPTLHFTDIKPISKPKHSEL